MLSVAETCFPRKSGKRFGSNADKRPEWVSYLSRLRRQQFSDRYLKSLCDPLNVVQADVPDLTFYMRDEGAVQLCFKRQRFLAPSPLCPQANHVERQHLARARDSFGWDLRSG